jgi:hypothetical protein
MATARGDDVTAAVAADTVARRVEKPREASPSSRRIHEAPLEPGASSQRLEPQEGSRTFAPRIVRGLRPDQIAAGIGRLALLALAAAIAIAVTGIVSNVVFPFPPRSPGAALWKLGMAAGVLLSLGMAAIARRDTLSSERLLDLGLVYEVLLALSAGLTFHSITLFTDVQPRGSSPVALWVLAYPLIVPNARGKTIVATLAAALMDPLALAISVAEGVPRPTLPVTVLILLPTALSAAVAIVVSSHMYELAVEAAHGREVGSYRLEELIGTGGMAEVWRGSHRMLARPAAIKLIRFDPVFNWNTLTKRFEREARATAALRSPHTVDVYDFGTTEDGSFYYVMELLDGFDLQTLVDRFGPVPPERAAFLLAQACHSLTEANERGLIHRDVKPANIFVSQYGIDSDFVKLMDFGIVKGPLPEPAESITGRRMAVGTPGYMSPEMVLGSSDVDSRTDIYALGCVAYWLLTGNRVFEGTATQVLKDHVKTPPRAPSLRIGTVLPTELERLVLACLEKDPANRPQTAREVGERLRKIEFENPWTEERARGWWLQNGARGRK